MNPTNLLTNNFQPTTQVSQFLKTPTTTSATPPPTQMDASTLNNPSTINLKPQTQTPMPDITTLMSSDSTNPQPQPTPEAPKKDYSWLMSKAESLFTGSKGKETELAGAVASASAPYAQQLNEIDTQIKTLQAQSIKNQEDAMRKGETLGFASREQQAIARTDAIQGLFLSAQAEGMRGNIALAEQRATQAINAKYAEMDKEIEDVKTNIYNNYDSMSAAEKKRADQTLLRIDAQDAFVKERKEDDKITQGFIQDAIQQSAQNGQPIPSLVLQRANKAETPTEALQILAPYMVDAQAKALALERLRGERLQNQKLGLEIDKMKAPTGVEANEFIQAQAKGNIDLISGLVKDKYLSTAVGPNPAARFSFTNLVTGGKSDFIAGVEQLKSQLSLDSLISAKAKGATFGALSDTEMKILTASASRLGTWAIKDKDGNVTGYKASEASFKQEMDKINNFAKLDYVLKGGNPADVEVIVQPDGTLWTKNSDGSYTQLR
jgi:hypothetical protein